MRRRWLRNRMQLVGLGRMGALFGILWRWGGWEVAKSNPEARFRGCCVQLVFAATTLRYDSLSCRLPRERLRETLSVQQIMRRRHTDAFPTRRSCCTERRQNMPRFVRCKAVRNAPLPARLHLNHLEHVGALLSYLWYRPPGAEAHDHDCLQVGRSRVRTHEAGGVLQSLLLQDIFAVPCDALLEMGLVHQNLRGDDVALASGSVARRW